VFLIIDNYDSFTYNLVQYLESLDVEVLVRRNDAISLENIARLDPEAIILSPGPGAPSGAGTSLDCLRRFAGRIPIFGVGLGHQCIAQAFGGRVVQAARLMHGKTSPVTHDGQGIFQGLASPFMATQYHSLIVEDHPLPACLEVSARTREGDVMGVRHRSLPVEGVQFHPASILTDGGMQLMTNVVHWARQWNRQWNRGPAATPAMAESAGATESHALDPEGEVKP